MIGHRLSLSFWWHYSTFSDRLSSAAFQKAKENVRIIFIIISLKWFIDLIHDLKFSMARHEIFEPQDHELVAFAKKRIRMWLGLQKQKKIRHHVRGNNLKNDLNSRFVSKEWSRLSQGAPVFAKTSTQLCQKMATFVQVRNPTRLV